MTAASYQSDPAVLAFESWMAPLLTGERPFEHRWRSPRWGAWTCSSLFDAYLRYDWPFTVVLPGTTDPMRGRSFPDTVRVFDTLSDAIRSAIATDDRGGFLEAAKTVVRWGGVRQNLARLDRLGEEALPSLVAAAAQLDPGHADLSRLDAIRDINSGFSKIYSLMLTDFPIYDSRVACALDSLVERYCRESGITAVPPSLELRLPPSRSTSRDPSRGPITFRRLWYGQVREYAASNLRAAWLLDLLSRAGPFGDLPGGQRVLALQSACFMLGYERLATA